MALPAERGERRGVNVTSCWLGLVPPPPPFPSRHFYPNIFTYAINPPSPKLPCLVQDFFYGRAVSSCCYLFWFCCYAPCCLLRNMWVKGGALSDQADSGAHVAASKDTDSDTGKMEEGQDTAETVTMHPPSNITPARPCCKPKMAFKSPQVFRLTPAFPRTRMARLARSVRPTRPNRKVDPKIRGSSFGKRFTAGLAGGRTERPKTRAIVGRTSERGRTDYRRHKVRSIDSGRQRKRRLARRVRKRFTSISFCMLQAVELLWRIIFSLKRR